MQVTYERFDSLSKDVGSDDQHKINNKGHWSVYGARLPQTYNEKNHSTQSKHVYMQIGNYSNHINHILC